MNALQKGHYITLLCYQQQSDSGSLTEVEIRALMGKDFDKNWPVIVRKFKVDNKGFYNERMRNEILKRAKYSESRRNNRTKKDQSYDEDMTTHMSNHMENVNENENKEGGVGETTIEPIGSEKVVGVANKVWGDQRWKEAICQGHHLPPKDLQKWMSQFNASICNDVMPDFSESKYKKIFGGWLNTQKAKGYTLTDTKPQTTQSATLKIPQ